MDVPCHLVREWCNTRGQCRGNRPGLNPHLLSILQHLKTISCRLNNNIICIYYLYRHVLLIPNVYHADLHLTNSLYYSILTVHDYIHMSCTLAAGKDLNMCRLTSMIKTLDKRFRVGLGISCIRFYYLLPLSNMAPSNIHTCTCMHMHILMPSCTCTSTYV